MIIRLLNNIYDYIYYIWLSYTDYFISITLEIHTDLNVMKNNEILYF